MSDFSLAIQQLFKVYREANQKGIFPLFDEVIISDDAEKNANKNTRELLLEKIFHYLDSELDILELDLREVLLLPCLFHKKFQEKFLIQYPKFCKLIYHVPERFHFFDKQKVEWLRKLIHGYFEVDFQKDFRTESCFQYIGEFVKNRLNLISDIEFDFFKELQVQRKIFSGRDVFWDLANCIILDKSRSFRENLEFILGREMRISYFCKSIFHEMQKEIRGMDCVYDGMFFDSYVEIREFLYSGKVSDDFIQIEMNMLLEPWRCKICKNREFREKIIFTLERWHGKIPKTFTDKNQLGDWKFASDVAIDVLTRWQNLEALFVYFRGVEKILKYTENNAAEQWKAREKFWTDHYLKGSIDRFKFLVCSGFPKANIERYCSRMDSDQKDHCGILVQMGKLTILDINHNGKACFYMEDNKRKPCFDNKMFYTRSSLRSAAERSYDSSTKKATNIKLPCKYGWESPLQTHAGNWQAVFNNIINDLR